MRTHVPSVPALAEADDRLLSEELACLAVRRQVAIVRALMDQLERVAASGAASLRAQLVEELARLGLSALETAAELSRTTEPAPESRILPFRLDTAAS